MSIGGVSDPKLVYVISKGSSASENKTIVFNSESAYLDTLKPGTQSEIIIEDVSGNLYKMNVRYKCSEEKATQLSESEKSNFKSKDIAKEPVSKNIEELKNKYNGMPVKVEQQGDNSIKYTVGEEGNCLIYTYNNYKNTPQLEISRDLRTTTAEMAKQEIIQATTGPNSKWNTKNYFAPKNAMDILLNIEKEIYLQLGTDFKIETIGEKTDRADSYLLTSQKQDNAGQPISFLAIRVKDNEGKAYYQIYKLNNDIKKEDLSDFAKNICNSISRNISVHTTDIFRGGGILNNPSYKKFVANANGYNVMCAGKTSELNGSFDDPKKTADPGKPGNPEPPGEIKYDGKDRVSFIGLFNYAKNTENKGIYEQGSTLTEYGEKVVDELVYLYFQGLITEQEIKSISFTTSYEGKDKATGKEDNEFNNEELSQWRSVAFFEEFNKRVPEDKKIHITNDEIKNAGKGETEHDAEYNQLVNDKNVSPGVKSLLSLYANAHRADSLDKDDPDPKGFEKWVFKKSSGQLKPGMKDYNILLEFHESGQKYRAGHMKKEITNTERSQWKAKLEEKYGKESVIAQAL